MTANDRGSKDRERIWDAILRSPSKAATKNLISPLRPCLLKVLSSLSSAQAVDMPVDQMGLGKMLKRQTSIFPATVWGAL